MAGGKGKRFDYKKIHINHQEKLLLKLGNKFIVEHVIDALHASENISRVILAVSPSSIHTKTVISSKNYPIEIIDTPGEGYHSDLKYAIKKLNLKTTMTIAGDIPLIKPEIIDDIIDKFFMYGKPSLAVMADIELFIKNNLKPTAKYESSEFKKVLVPLGINIIDGHYIDQPEIEQSIYISDKTELLYNINTFEDYMQLKAYFNE